MSTIIGKIEFKDETKYGSSITVNRQKIFLSGTKPSQIPFSVGDRVKVDYSATQSGNKKCTVEGISAASDSDADTAAPVSTSTSFTGDKDIRIMRQTGSKIGSECATLMKCKTEDEFIKTTVRIADELLTYYQTGSVGNKAEAAEDKDAPTTATAFG